jgi:transcriptional regulator with XRE-family HTH domain
MTQAQLASHMDVTPNTVARWETIRPPRGDTLIALRKVALEFGRSDLERIFLLESAAELSLSLGGDSLVPMIMEWTGRPVNVLHNALHTLEKANPIDAPRAIRAYHRAVRAIVAAHAQLYAELSKLPRKDPEDLAALERSQTLLKEIVNSQKHHESK